MIALLSIDELNVTTCPLGGMQSFPTLSRIAISVNLISCSSSGNQFSFTNNTANANVSWIIQDGPNNMFTLNGDFVTGLITSNTFTVTASFDNACYGDITRTLNADDFRTPEIDVELESCGPNGNTYNFENTQMTVGTWTIESGGVVIATEVGHTITATINADNFSVTLLSLIHI